MDFILVLIPFIILGSLIFIGEKNKKKIKEHEGNLSDVSTVPITPIFIRNPPAKNLYKVQVSKTENTATLIDVDGNGIKTVPLGSPAAEISKKEEIISAAQAAFDAIGKESPKEELYVMVYKDSSGTITKREFNLRSFLKNDYGFYIMAYCHMRQSVRQFTVKNIIELYRNGTKIPNPVRYFELLYENSDVYKTLQVINEHFNEIMAMIFMARADSIMRKNEREVMLRYIDSFQEGVNVSEADEILKKTDCTLAEFNKILKTAKEWDQKSKERFLDCASQIYLLKKDPDPMEKAALEKIKKAVK